MSMKYSGTYLVSATENATKDSYLRKLICYVRLLDGTQEKFEINAKAKGEELLAVVANYLELIESEYFGIQFLEENYSSFSSKGENKSFQQWVDPTKSLKKQIKSASSSNFIFRVKYFVPDPSLLYDEYTRYQFFMQIKHDILTGTLPCPYTTAVQLSGYVVQSELGDYSDVEHTGDYLSEFTFIPRQTKQFIDDVAEIHPKLIGLTPGEAELEFLQQAKFLEFYGVLQWEAVDHLKIPVRLGVSHTGVSIILDGKLTRTYLWSNIVKLSFRRKNFFIHLKKRPDASINSLPPQSSDQSNNLSFTLPSSQHCKMLWRCCIDYHIFFRCKEPPITINAFSRGGFFSSSRSFTFSGRTLNGLLESRRKIRVPRGFTRTGSSRVGQRSFDKSALMLLSNERLKKTNNPPILNESSNGYSNSQIHSTVTIEDDITNSPRIGLSKSSSRTSFNPLGIPNRELPSKSNYSCSSLPKKDPTRDVNTTSNISSSKIQSNNERFVKDQTSDVDNHTMPKTRKVNRIINNSQSMDSLKEVQVNGDLAKSSRAHQNTRSPGSLSPVEKSRRTPDKSPCSNRQSTSYTLQIDPSRSAQCLGSQDISGDPSEFTVCLRPLNGRFGFNVKGGADKGMPSLISRIGADMPADLCQPKLSVGDEILSINGIETSTYTHDQIVHLIKLASDNADSDLVLVVKSEKMKGVHEPSSVGAHSPEVTSPRSDCDTSHAESSFARHDDGNTKDSSPVILPEPLKVPSQGATGDELNDSILALEETLKNGVALSNFEQLYRRKPGLTMNTANYPDNIGKNRYRDISPYDQTRVILKHTVDNNNYINASYVNMLIPGRSGCEGTLNRYIAAQGPLPATCSAFWQMCWEQEISLVVMLTANVEKGRSKCHQYWPNLNESTSYDHVSLTCLSEESPSKSLVIREFQLQSSVSSNKAASSTPSPKKRHLIHIQYLTWPDHGVPSDSLELIDVLKQVRKRRLEEPEKPILVHCSAGIGRTGVLIALETAVCLIERNYPVIPFNIVREMRDQRAMLIQTPNQYTFVCEAIVKLYKDGVIKPII